VIESTRKQYNNTEMKYGATFYDCHTPAVEKYKNLKRKTRK
jgi:hypothetical protein